MAIARATNNFSLVKGEDYQINWTIQTSDTNTAAVDITGWTFALNVKRKASDTTATVITATTTITTAASGLVKSVFAAADTVLLEGDYVYDFWRTNTGAVTCLSTGFLSVVDTATN